MDEKELRRLMYTAALPDKGCFVIRYPRGRGIYTEWKCPLETIEVGTGRKINDGEDVAVLTLGPIGNDVQDVIATMDKKPAHYDMRFLKPLDENLLKEVAEKYMASAMRKPSFVSHMMSMRLRVTAESS